MKVAIPQSWNRYTYVLNNPLLYIDPNGEEWIANTGKDKDKNPYTWVDKCSEGQQCWKAVAAVVDGDLLYIYGSKNATNITKYMSNKFGQINVHWTIAMHPDANFISVAKLPDQNIPEQWLSINAAKIWFNVASIYKDDYPNDGKLVFATGNMADGKPCTYSNGVACHKSHQGSDIDIRYMDKNGKDLKGKGAYLQADVERTKHLMELFSRGGFTKSFTGNTSKFGSSPAGPKTEAVHYDHLHVGPNQSKPNINRKKL